MKHNIFISYPSSQVDIVQNLKSHLHAYGVKAWVYASDRTYTAEVWSEITQKVVESDLVIFVISEDTPEAEGQQHELILASKSKILPLFKTGVNVWQ